jgi:hypothetical protein
MMTSSTCPSGSTPERRARNLHRSRRIERVEGGSRGLADAAYQKWRLKAESIADVLLQEERAWPKPSLPRVLWLERPLLPE